MNTPIYIPMTVSANQAALSMTVGAAIVTSVYPEYEGATQVTPTANTQILLTEDMVVHENIVINPIPSNWGLITWDGTSLTVS